MTDKAVSGDIEEFILTHIDSIAQLEALLLLRANPDVSWDAAGTARRLYVSEHEGEGVLARLCADGLINRDDKGYRYAPVRETATLVDRLAEAYARQLIPITNIIHQRSGRIRAFADAFKLKREP